MPAALVDRARGTPITRGNYAESPHCYKGKTCEMLCHKDIMYKNSQLICRTVGSGHPMPPMDVARAGIVPHLTPEETDSGKFKGPCSQEQHMDLGLLATSRASLQGGFAYAFFFFF